MFRRVFLAAILAGLASGLLVTALQAAKLTPLIAAAEVSEAAATSSVDHAQGWEPAAGFERVGFTLLANIVIAVGFGLLLAAGFALRDILSGAETDAAQGLLWGLAGFASFALAPSLGLPPALPGSAEAELVARQSWWIGTALATAAGIAVIVFTASWWWRALGVFSLLLPHIVGAPPTPPAGGTAPAALAAEFAAASLVVAAVFWAALGSLCGWLYARLGRRGER